MSNTLPTTSLAFADTPPQPRDFLPPAPEPAPESPAPAPGVQPATDINSKVGGLISYLKAKGLVYDPWQVAAYVTAVRTKPFVVLAGISGTGKTKLPRIAAEATGAEFLKVSVRPDWTDSSELLGYERLDGTFVPGVLLRFAKSAMENRDKQFFFLLDEMNVARVEHYFAEILSHIEERRPLDDGRIMSEPLLGHLASGGGDDWRNVRLPDNLCIVSSAPSLTRVPSRALIASPSNRPPPHDDEKRNQGRARDVPASPNFPLSLRDVDSLRAYVRRVLDAGTFERGAVVDLVTLIEDAEESGVGLRLETDEPEAAASVLLEGLLLASTRGVQARQFMWPGSPDSTSRGWERVVEARRQKIQKIAASYGK